MCLPTVPSRSRPLSCWFRIGAGVLGLIGAQLLCLAAPPTTTPASADCIDYSQYWHEVSRIRCGHGDVNVVAGHYTFVLESGDSGEDVFFDVVDIADPANPALLVRLPTKEAGVAMAMSGTHVYCLEGYYGFRCMQIIDVSDPVKPILDATLETAYGNIEDIAVSGDYAYIAAYPEVVIVDVSDSHEPVVVGSIPIPAVAVAVEVFDHYLCVAARVIYGNDPAVAGLYIVDISVPGSPVIVGFVHTDEAGPVDFAIAGSHAFVVTPWYGGSSTFHVIDLSDPTNPMIVCSLPAGDNVIDVIVSDTMAYVTQYGGVQAIDVSDPTRPVLRAMLRGSGGSGSLSGYHLYLGGLSIVDVRNPTDPAPVSTLDLAEAWHVLARGQYAYVTGGYWEGWLKVVDLADPFHPNVVGSTDLMGIRMAIERSSVYVTIRNWGLAEVDVSRPTDPTIVRWSQLPGSPEDVTMGRGIAYVTLGSNGLVIVDTRQYSWPVIGALDTPGSAGAIALSGSYAYIADYSAGVQVVDVSTPSDPQIVANVPCGNTWDLAVSGHYLYVAGLEIFVIDISVPTAPQIVSTCDVSPAGYPWIDVRGPIAYSCVAGGVEILDVSDPKQLRILGFISGEHSIGVDPSGALVYSIDVDPGDTGLYIYWGQCAPTTAVEGRNGEALRGAAGAKLQIAPNPSVHGRSTRIRLEMSGIGVPTDAPQASGAGPLEISIYDATGRRVRRLPEAGRRSGPLDVTWDGFDAMGHQVAPGVYLIRAAAAGTTHTARVVIME